MTDGTTGDQGFLKKCVAASTSGPTWVALGSAFLALGVSGSSGAHIGLGAAFLAIGLGRVIRQRRHSSSS